MAFQVGHFYDSGSKILCLSVTENRQRQMCESEITAKIIMVLFQINQSVILAKKLKQMGNCKKMKITVITNCTNRKRIQPTEKLRARSLSAGTSIEVAEQWSDRLLRSDGLMPANEVYCGRSFSEAYRATALIQGRLQIASAGLGLINSETNIPSYSATVSSGSEDNILKFTEGSAIEWWNAIKERSPFSVEITSQGQEMILVALSRPYLTLLLDTFNKWPESDIKKLRLFVRVSKNELPHKLQMNLMPYDARFDNPMGPRPGTQADFAQRALNHFVEHILPHSYNENCQYHARMINQCLKSLTPPEKLNRKKVTDEEVKALIRSHWSDVGGSSTLMLRYLRRELGVACEQSRFKFLFHEVRDKKSDSYFQ